MKKKLKKYEVFLPYTVEILSMLENGDYMDIVEIEEKNTIALKNNYDEWIGFLGQKDGMKDVLDIIRAKGENQRGIFFSHKEEIFGVNDISNIPYIKKYHFEDFMVYSINSVKSVKIETRVPSMEEISSIATLNHAYREEEISWLPYHKSAKEIEEDYRFHDRYKNVLGIGNPFHTMGEFVAEYKKYRLIGRIFVKQSYRGKGIGIKLIEGMTKTCHENGFVPVLTVRSDNMVASHIYQKCNFTIEGKVLYCHI